MSCKIAKVTFASHLNQLLRLSGPLKPLLSMGEPTKMLKEQVIENPRTAMQLIWNSISSLLERLARTVAHLLAKVERLATTLPLRLICRLVTKPWKRQSTCIINYTIISRIKSSTCSRNTMRKYRLGSILRTCDRLPSKCGQLPQTNTTISML